MTQQQSRESDLLASTVHIIDDDDAPRDALIALLDSVGIPAMGHASGVAFLDHYDGSRPCCVVTDLRMPVIGGLQVLDALRSHGHDMPVIVLTAHGDVTTAVRAMRTGAIDFMQKPVNGQIFIDRIQECLSLDAHVTSQALEKQRLQTSLSSLTQRELEVLRLLLQGMSSREIATGLDISIKTVQIHRSRIMEKTGASSVVELYREIGDLLPDFSGPTCMTGSPQSKHS